jgi:beta-N-acetylhexosaminidase
VGTDSQGELSRRDLLRAIAVGSLAAGLAACGATPVIPTADAEASSSATGPSDSSSSSGAPTSISPSPSAAIPSPAPTPTPSLVSRLTLRQKIGQLLIVGFRGQRASRTSPAGRAIAAGELGGVILFNRNIVSPAQLGELTAGLAALAPRVSPLLVAVDQEGGNVLRLGPSHGFPDVPSEAAVGVHGAAYATTVYWAMAATLTGAGINLNLAPVVDVNVNPGNPAIGTLDRSFSADPALVTELARAAIGAYHGHGVLATIKHFPGLGSAAANTDFAVVDVTKTWSAAELGPFRALTHGDADCVMVGHIVNRTLDAKWPASLSQATVDGLLRGQLGWQGPVITDDLQAAAIKTRYKRTDAIAAALNAGVDLLLLAAATADAAFYSDLVDSIEGLVRTGRVKESRIDQAVARVAVLRAQT